MVAHMVSLVVQLPRAPLLNHMRQNKWAFQHSFERGFDDHEIGYTLGNQGNSRLIHSAQLPDGPSAIGVTAGICHSCLVIRHSAQYGE